MRYLREQKSTCLYYKKVCKIYQYVTNCDLFYKNFHFNFKIIDKNEDDEYKNLISIQKTQIYAPSQSILIICGTISYFNHTNKSIKQINFFYLF